MSVRTHMLDTDTVSFVMRNEGRAAAVLTSHPPSSVCISAMTLAELRFGAEKRRSRKLHKLIDAFIAGVQPFPFDAAAAATFGRVRASLEARGLPIGVFDTQIAAHALSQTLVLVTNNTKHFRAVRGLRLENWC